MITEKKVYPDQLNITIRTSVPGYQNIEYKPSMTIKNTDEKNIKFNPLIKLNKSIIDKIPEEYKIKSFFNKGLFQSLLNKNGGTPAKNLVQATSYGYVDNNIKITLDSIFPVGSAIYIGKRPYAIGDVQWTNGDWKIDIKQKKEQIDPNKVMDPELYTQLIKDEIISGEEQLNDIPEIILTGNNYSGAPVARGIKSAATPTSSMQASSSVKPSQSITTITNPTTTQSITTTTQPITTPQITTPQITTPQITTPQITSPTTRQTPSKNIPLLEPQTPDIEEISPEEERLFETFKDDLKTDVRNTNFFRKYFLNDSYFNIVRLIFDKFPQPVKREIRKFYFMTTNYQVKKDIDSLNPSIYKKLCEQVSILESPSDGDCFFRAVADGINIYNYENQDSKIIYANYGKKGLFTIHILREIVSRYIESLDQQIIDQMLIISKEQVEPLNNKFEEAINSLKNNLHISDLTPQQYQDTLNIIVIPIFWFINRLLYL